MNDKWTSWIQEMSRPDSRMDIVLNGFTRCSTEFYIRPRVLSEHLIYQVLEHSVHAIFADSEQDITVDQLLWVPPGIEHSLTTTISGTEVLVYHHRFHLAPDCPADHPVILPSSTYRRHLFAHLHDGSDNDDPLWLLRYRSALILIFSEIAMVSKQQQKKGSLLNSRQRQQIMQAIHEDPWLDPERLAILLDYHPAYFTRLFKRSFGQSPRSWLLAQRMHVAGHLLLESSKPIHHIAEDVGYSDPFLFSRQFKQIHSMSPRMWRNTYDAPRIL